MASESTQPAGAASSLPPEAIEFATRMFDAAREGSLEVFQQALPQGLPSNLTNEKGDTLLMLAAYHGHADIVKLLVQHGADPNRRNDRGQSPLAGAVFKQEDAVIEVGSAQGRAAGFLLDANRYRHCSKAGRIRSTGLRLLSSASPCSNRKRSGRPSLSRRLGGVKRWPLKPPIRRYKDASMVDSATG
ncbi:ankyrin [Thozetella sp. PMI_491]|nr:ankyrin [Thozetella sp. PMI_491]